MRDARCFLRPPAGAGALVAALALMGAAAPAQAQQAATQTYIVQLTGAPTATYSGTVPGLRATKPTGGARLDTRAPDVQAYARFLHGRQLASLASVGGGRALHHYSHVLNGYAARLTPAQARALKSQAGVLSVEPSRLHKLATVSTPDYLGLSTPGGLWSQLDVRSLPVKGENIIIGVLDTGIWPENPSFGDKVDAQGNAVAYHQAGVPAYGPPPAGWTGRCDAGPGFSADMCGGKLIGARYYIDDFRLTAPQRGAELSSLDYASPRDGNGHGSHTASTAAGNADVPATVRLVTVGRMSGIAPRARIASYKVCWQATLDEATGCYSADTIKAVDDALSDGVHIITYSIGGNEDTVAGPVDRAFLNAAAAGVFVSVAAGNSGPGTVNHLSPWVTTVAAASDDRANSARLRFSDGTLYQGVSAMRLPVPDAPVVLGSSIAAAGSSAQDAGLCAPGSLDPAKAAGRMVVCDRGTYPRLDKSAAVRDAGGAAMVMLSTEADQLQPDYHFVPAVHLPHTMRDAVRARVLAGGARAGIVPTEPPVRAVSPVLASFSSGGPGRVVDSIFKPDIAAPGVNIVAAFGDNSLSQAEHDALALGNLRGRSLAAPLSGTSMATPHVAGVAALLRQLHPSWTPAAIKSALVTTAAGMKLADGRDDPDRAGYGGGHISPNAAAAVPLVYDAVPADYGRFLCGQGLDPGPVGNCALLGGIEPWNLNLPFLSAGTLRAVTDRTFVRTVTNVTNAQMVFNATANLPGWQVDVQPAQLTLPPGGQRSFTVRLRHQGAPFGRWVMGTLVWSNGVQSVTSPLAARVGGMLAPALVTDERKVASARKLFTVTSGEGLTSDKTVVRGLVPATRTAGTVAPGSSACTDIQVPADVDVLRVQLFSVDTAGGATTDLNLQLFRGAGGVGPMVGASTGPQSDEAVALLNPAPGTYSACVVAGAVPAGGAAYTLSSWIVGPQAPATLRAQLPFAFAAGTPASVVLAWTVPLGQRYLGVVKFRDDKGDLAPATQVLVDNR